MVQNFFPENVSAIEMRKTETFMNRPVHLGLSMLELIKTLMYEFWYGFVKPKYDEKLKLCYIDTDNFTVYTKTDDIYNEIAKDDIMTKFVELRAKVLVP